MNTKSRTVSKTGFLFIQLLCETARGELGNIIKHRGKILNIEHQENLKLPILIRPTLVELVGLLLNKAKLGNWGTAN